VTIFGLATIGFGLSNHLWLSLACLGSGYPSVSRDAAPFAHDVVDMGRDDMQRPRQRIGAQP